MKSLTVTLWNIQGIKSSSFGFKTTALEFKKNIKNMDIIILQETWCRNGEMTLCPTGYCEIVISSRKHSKVTRGRDSGGIIIWYKTEIANFITTSKIEESHVWLKINKKLTQTESDIFLCALYIPPSESPYYNEEIFENLHSQINDFQAQGKVLICGDLNARTGSLPDFTSDDGNNHILGSSFPQDLMNLHFRNTSDKIINKNGKSLIELCKNLGLYMLNGRVRGDSFGRYTYSSSLGSSTVDYMITDLDPFTFRAFTVKPLTPLSDHSQITVYFKIIKNTSIFTRPSKLYNIREKYKWTENSKEDYLKAICHPQVSPLIETFLNNTYPYNKECVNYAVESLNNIFNHTASISCLKTTNRIAKKMKNGLIEIAKPLERMSGFCQTKSTDALMTLVYDLIISTSSKNIKTHSERRENSSPKIS